MQPVARFFLSRPFWLHLALALVGFFLICWATLAWLAVWTAHGQEIRVPLIRGLQMEQARAVAAKQELNIQVTDSVFVDGAQAGEILEQDPLPNSTVKQNRIIYVTIASGKVPRIGLPPLVDLTLRQAELTLSNVGLKKGKVIERSDIASTHILDVQLNGRHLEAGTFIPRGSSIDLVVGSGAIEQETIMPDLTGLSYHEAEEVLSSSGLNLGNVNFMGAILDSNAALVVRQEPPFESDKKILPGSYINIWLR